VVLAGPFRCSARVVRYVTHPTIDFPYEQTHTLRSRHDLVCNHGYTHVFRLHPGVYPTNLARYEGGPQPWYAQRPLTRAHAIKCRTLTEPHSPHSPANSFVQPYHEGPASLSVSSTLLARLSVFYPPRKSERLLYSSPTPSDTTGLRASHGGTELSVSTTWTPSTRT
jgi:hypothetical protein